ncbi:hypothetical protein Hanom_Chr13g01224761 [Helianthus anomalus]
MIKLENSTTPLAIIMVGRWWWWWMVGRWWWWVAVPWSLHLDLFLVLFVYLSGRYVNEIECE